MEDHISPDRVRRGRSSLALAVLVLVLAGMIGMSAVDGIRSQVLREPADTPNAMLCSLQESFSAIARQAEPGVVSITAVQKAGGAFENGVEMQGFGELFKWFFDDELDQEFRDLQFPGLREPSIVTAAGSGAIVRRQGDNFYVLTNYHVVEDAYRLTVRLSDGTPLKGTVVGIDPVTDIAVIRISSPVLTDKNVLPLGDSASVNVGAWALAMGSPFGFEHSLTVGVVSALHRELEEGETVYPDLIQTDASINKGNSGGPLLDVQGQVIGINTAIASPTGGFIGLGFAIPINTAAAILDTLIADGRIVRGWLGVGIQELTPVLSEYYKVENGVLVASVEDGGPAAEGGFREEDVIVRVGDSPAADIRQLQKLVAETAPGTPIRFTAIRSGKQQVLNVKIGLSPSTPASRPVPPRPPEDGGIQVRTLNSELAARVGMPGLTGVIVLRVLPGSPAAEAGLEEGDVISRFSGRAVTSEHEFMGWLGAARSGDIVVLKVVRGGSPRMIGFRME